MDNTVTLLGLALRAGRLEAGEECARDACKAKTCRLLIVAQDAAAGSVRRAMFAAEEGQCLCLTVPYTRSELGSAIGRELCAVAAITDTGFAGAFARKLADRDPERYGPAAERLRLKAERARKRRENRQSKSSNSSKSKRTPKKREKRN